MVVKTKQDCLKLPAASGNRSVLGSTKLLLSSEPVKNCILFTLSRLNLFQALKLSSKRNLKSLQAGWLLLFDPLIITKNSVTDLQPTVTIHLWPVTRTCTCPVTPGICSICGFIEKSCILHTRNDNYFNKFK